MLVAKLLAADENLRTNGAHPLAASIDVVAALSAFIAADPVLHAAGVSVAFRRLIAALVDTAAGARPAMLFGGAIDQAGKPGRRTRLTFHYFRGAIVAALTILIKAGMSNAHAAKIVEIMLAAAHVQWRGNAIEMNRILQWREQKDDNAPELADESADMILGMLGRRFSLVGFDARQIALLKVQGIVEIVARWNSR